MCRAGLKHVSNTRLMINSIRGRAKLYCALPPATSQNNSRQPASRQPRMSAFNRYGARGRRSRPPNPRGSSKVDVSCCSENSWPAQINIPQCASGMQSVLHAIMHHFSFISSCDEVSVFTHLPVLLSNLLPRQFCNVRLLYLSFSVSTVFEICDSSCK